MDYKNSYISIRLLKTLLIVLSVYSSKFLGVKAFIPLGTHVNIPIPLNPGLLVSYTGGRLLRNFETNNPEKSNVENAFSCLVRTSIGDSILISQYLQAAEDEVDFWIRTMQIFKIVLAANFAVIGASMNKDNSFLVNDLISAGAGFTVSKEFELLANALSENKRAEIDANIPWLLNLLNFSKKFLPTKFTEEFEKYLKNEFPQIEKILQGMSNELIDERKTFDKNTIQKSMSLNPKYSRLVGFALIEERLPSKNATFCFLILKLGYFLLINKITDFESICEIVSTLTNLAHIMDCSEAEFVINKTLKKEGSIKTSNKSVIQRHKNLFLTLNRSKLRRISLKQIFKLRSGSLVNETNSLNHIILTNFNVNSKCCQVILLQFDDNLLSKKFQKLINYSSNKNVYKINSLPLLLQNKILQLALNNNEIIITSDLSFKNVVDYCYFGEKTIYKIKFKQNLIIKCDQGRKLFQIIVIILLIFRVIFESDQTYGINFTQEPKTYTEQLIGPEINRESPPVIDFDKIFEDKIQTPKIQAPNIDTANIDTANIETSNVNNKDSEKLIQLKKESSQKIKQINSRVKTLEDIKNDEEFNNAEILDSETNSKISNKISQKIKN